MILNKVLAKVAGAEQYVVALDHGVSVLLDLDRHVVTPAVDTAEFMTPTGWKPGYEPLSDVPITLRKQATTLLEGGTLKQVKLAAIGPDGKGPYGKESKTQSKALYHGTTVRNVKHILKEGITGLDDYVYVTKSQKTALEYAEDRADEIGTKAVVLKLSVPKADAKTFHSQGGGEFFRDAGIPPDWIVDVFDTKGKSLKKKYKLADDGEFETFFVAVLTDGEEEDAVDLAAIEAATIRSPLRKSGVHAQTQIKART